jgi:WXG100 family type VII secretion target
MMNNIIKDSDPAEMRKISKKIAVYADNLKKDMKKLMQTHQGMHSSWSGKQYDDFSKAIEDANSVIEKQVKELMVISERIEDDARQLEISHGVDLG